MRFALRLLLPAVVALVALAGCGSGGSSSTATTAAPAVPLDRVELERSGGVAAPREPDRIVVTDRADLDRLAALIPATAPKPEPGGPSGCADCREYKLTLVRGTTARSSRFTEIDVPPAYKALVAELSSRL